MRDYLVSATRTTAGPSAPAASRTPWSREARAAVADFLGAARPEEIVLRPEHDLPDAAHLAEPRARAFPGDEIVRDAGWTTTRTSRRGCSLAADRGCTVRWVDFDPADCTWSVESWRARSTTRTKLVAVGLRVERDGHDQPRRARPCGSRTSAGALCFVDAVHYAPHGPIDVQALGCDFLACSRLQVLRPAHGIL